MGVIQIFILINIKIFFEIITFQVFSYLPITVSIEDVNDNVPEFVNAPYGPIVVDELAPPGIVE